MRYKDKHTIGGYMNKVAPKWFKVSFYIMSFMSVVNVVTVRALATFGISSYIFFCIWCFNIGFVPV